ncbi:tRNA dihydrouridine synthase DusB [Eubacteriales bacterium OttesenSCG-928-K08]|nr:tRNA dihydrouridine synthase DusB [Eubacteriales bacterium OttesenSCG-928-K08]
MRLGTLNSPFPVFLAPMAGVSDLPFRVLCKEMGCDLTYTEMISAKGLQYKNERTNELLKTAPQERPCGVQLFGSEPDIVAQMAAKIEQISCGEILLIDLNMGCPAHKIVANGEGSALMKTPLLAAKIIERTVNAVRLPVTVKFRKGWDDTLINALEFAKMAEQSGAAAITLHGRTRAQGYSGNADWNCIGEVKAALKIPVIGNGDVYCAADALRLRAHTDCDGVMVARGAQGNPFIFREIQSALKGRYCPPPTLNERIDMALRHARAQLAYKGEHGLIEMRKHIAWYVRGLPKSAQLRTKINECRTLDELESLLMQFCDELNKKVL